MYRGSTTKVTDVVYIFYLICYSVTFVVEPLSTHTVSASDFHNFTSLNNTEFYGLT